MSATRHTVTEPKPPFWSRPRVFIGVCVAIVVGLGGALYTQDNVKSAGILRQLFGNIGGLSADQLIR